MRHVSYLVIHAVSRVPVQALQQKLPAVYELEQNKPHQRKRLMQDAGKLTEEAHGNLANTDMHAIS